MEAQDVFAMLFMFGMFSGVLVIYMALRQRSHQMEMQHRERMAMIEKGQVPSDKPDFVHQLIIGGAARRLSGQAESRSMTLGIVIVAVGLALMTIISIAGDSPEAGVGVGGAIAILGVAFIVNAFVSRNSVSNVPDVPQYGPPPPPVRRDGPVE